ncbi:ER membrane complex subunit 2, partial [Blyttiomyces sp. JEL0837]
NQPPKVKMATKPIVTDPTAELLRLASLRSGVDMAEMTGSGVGAIHYDPHRVLAVGGEILANHKSHIRSDLERYGLYEQLFVAALDVGNTDLARDYLALITKKFPIPENFVAPPSTSSTPSASREIATTPQIAATIAATPLALSTSNRALRLAGMLAESESDFDRALAIYTAALTLDEANGPIQKRRIAMQWAAGRRADAIAALVEYLDHFMQDSEAWCQLSDWYLVEGMPQQAAYCLEEMMMLKPAHHPQQLRYADLMKTMGRNALALKYYCAALQGCKDNVRALYGIRVTTSTLLEGEAAAAGKKGVSAAAAARMLSGDAVISEGVAGFGAEDVELPTLDVVRKLHTLAEERLSAVYEAAAAEQSGREAGLAEIVSVVKAWLKTGSN